MLAARDNETLTCVSRGTPMGDLMREFWVPACLSSELVAEAPPIRLLLLGEHLIAFRDSSGRVGIMDHRCPHRCASLFFGRNEGNGLRCIYHGWKFDIEGNCLEMPNIPRDREFSARVKAKAYRAVERGGLVWTYMGRRAEAPPLPHIEVLMLPQEDLVIRCHQRECNWLQSLEGDIDTSHFGFLHVGRVQSEDVDPTSIHRFAVIDRAPEYHVCETDWGTMYSAYRKAEPGLLYHRVAHFVFPFFALVPDGDFKDMLQATLSVPMDDTHTMTIGVSWARRTRPPLRTLKGGAPVPGAEANFEYLPRTNDWYGRWRLVARRDNDYLIDREAQRSSSYTGIQGIAAQDQAAVESMGEIVDRSLEHLAVSDRMITTTRRRLLIAARAHAEQGTTPAIVDRPELYRGARGGSFVAPEDQDWLSAYAQQLKEAVSPIGIVTAA